MDLWPLIQSDILGVLQADEFLGARPGVLVEPGDIDSVIATKIATVVGPGLDGKNGVGFLVRPIERAEDDNVALPGGPLKLTISVQWVENVLLNRSATGARLPIRIHAAHTARLLKLYTPVGLAQNLVPARPVISEFTDSAQKNLRLGTVNFTALEADFLPFLRVNRPQIAVAGAAAIAPNLYQLAGPATITVSAPEADRVFYTTNGSHPFDRNPHAQPYTAPVTVTRPGLFRVRAFARGKTASDTAAVHFIH